MNTQKYCKHCGQLIDKECVICVHCGKQVEELKSNSDKNIYINNSASAAASSAVSIPEKRKKKYNLLLDLILILCTGGLWIIWMIVRPKYEY